MLKLISALVASFVLVSSFASADPVQGSYTDVDVLTPGRDGSYTVPVNGDELTRFKITGDGDGDIDCWLYNSEGDLVASETSTNDGCVIDRRPHYKSTYRLEFKNVGRRTTIYTFMVW